MLYEFASVDGDWARTDEFCHAARVQCDPDTCPCGDNCKNVLFSGTVSGRKVRAVEKSAKCGVFNTQKKGWALKALEDVAKGR